MFVRLSRSRELTPQPGIDKSTSAKQRRKGQSIYGKVIKNRPKRKDYPSRWRFSKRKFLNEGAAPGYGQDGIKEEVC